MDEFQIINAFFHRAIHDPQVLCGPGDDAACMQLSDGHVLCVSTDTLVADVHFLPQWRADWVAGKAVVTNISDIAAMAAIPKWMSVALTLPDIDEAWLKMFSQGLFTTLQTYHVTLVGGDITKGPLTITMTIHGEAVPESIVYRHGAKPGDLIFVSGKLGAPALAVDCLTNTDLASHDKAYLMQRLQCPVARIDFRPLISRYATSCIDISDGLVGDLEHICQQSGVGALLEAVSIPIDPVVSVLKPEQALHYALHGGDEYQLCFTVPAEQSEHLQAEAKKQGLSVYQIGIIIPDRALYLKNGSVTDRIQSQSYKHF